jgi:formylglycine-generating enzyme required for sulfatase activity
MGSDTGPSSARPQHLAELPTFRIGRYPITNLQYLRFMAAGGYDEPRWWLPDGWQWRDQKSATAPAFWGDALFNWPEQPVVGICWYEAAAYAAWWSERTGRPFRLPSEAEWERAARGLDGRLWPWGQDFEPGHGNTAEEGYGRPTAVNAYADGATPEGVFDLAGNVWEWCRTRWGRAWQTLEYRYPYDATDGREDEGRRFARGMRGGSWFDSWVQAAAPNRGRYLPGSRGSNIGFRLVEMSG